MSPVVLIVDDSLTVRMDLAEAFEAAGFRPIPCATAGEAREFLSRESAALVVVDVLLPDADGVEFLKELRESPSASGSAVLMLSTEAEVRDRIRGLTRGADEYVGKPYDAGYVIARARELLRGAHGDRGGGGTTILVIDDSATFREELRLALESAGYHALTASSGEEGLRMAADRRPNGIVVDGVLPGVDGATVIRRIRLDVALRRVPCILLTLSDEEGAELRALDAGADAFVRKDAELPVILARLAAVLRASGSARDQEPAPSLMGPKKILAVDDSLTYLHELSEALRSEGYDVALAHSGEEALDLLAVQPVDCVLLDLLMPGLNGKDTCRRIKAAPAVRDTPVIMLTAVEDREAMLQGLAAGADDYIAKSSDLEVLKARVRAQLRRRLFEDENRRIREQLMRKEFEAAEAQAARELAELRAAHAEELEQKNRELEAFSYSVSHDLRAPLRSIDGFSDTLLQDCGGSLDPAAHEHLRRMRSAAQHMGRLIDDLLHLSQVGRADLRRERVDFSGIARSVAAGLEKAAPAQRVRVAIQDGIAADADPGLARILLDNLLGNAWKFTAQADESMIEFGALTGKGETVYFVRDNGVGFDMGYAEKLFAPFQRLHSQSEFPGTGIGLATVQRIVDRHGGRVWAEGAVGKGATVFWTLPSTRTKIPT